MTLSPQKQKEKTLEALVAWFGQADKGIFAIEGKPAHETWAEGELLELGLFGGSAFLDPADLAGSRVQHPKLATIEAPFECGMARPPITISRRFKPARSMRPRSNAAGEADKLAVKGRSPQT